MILPPYEQQQHSPLSYATCLGAHVYGDAPQSLVVEHILHILIAQECPCSSIACMWRHIRILLLSCNHNMDGCTEVCFIGRWEHFHSLDKLYCLYHLLHLVPYSHNIWRTKWSVAHLVSDKWENGVVPLTLQKPTASLLSLGGHPDPSRGVWPFIPLYLNVLTFPVVHNQL